MHDAPILIIKVGTSTLLGKVEIPSKTFDHVATSINDLCTKYRIVLVTSGAIGFGVVQTKLTVRPTDVRKLQALSMIGQVGLLRRWREAFGDKTIGQVLVTRRDLFDHDATVAFCESIAQIWQYGAVPVVNENDAVSNEEITFGDNDQLAAEIAVALGAERLVLLSDQDGIQSDFGTELQSRLEVVSLSHIDQHILPTKSAFGSGGASSKAIAAGRALECGIEVFVANAASVRAIETAISGQSGTKIVQ